MLSVAQRTRLTAYLEEATLSESHKITDLWDWLPNSLAAGV